MAVEFPTTAHNAQISGDVLTNVSLNYEWRRFVAIAVHNELSRQFATNDDGTILDDLESWLDALITDLYTEDIVDGTPVGTIVAFADYNNVPAKWLYCNGALVAKATYPALYTLCGTKYGAQTSTHFRIPNLVQRFVFGADNGAPTYQQGVSGGEEAVELTISNIPAHHHVVPAHNHTFPTYNNTAHDQNFVWGVRATSQIGTGTVSTQPATNTSSEGSNASHNNMPPYVAVGMIIKALP